ncbi:DUF1810 domain-containing protein [uncultured Amnibacterium sp.]|uniref:DUF1810 domain-containing protein n=1 Tax=uncultured Amnibacterium sp. TaxID=1631851 RepID=UPI0035CC56DC
MATAGADERLDPIDDAYRRRVSERSDGMSERSAGDGDERFDLERFVRAQDDGDTIGTALRELRRGRKTSHWMWFVFPQLAGLGMSAMSQRFAIVSLAEARAYLAHPVLGPRLRECMTVVAESSAASAAALFGGIDATKARSSATLFLRAAPDEPVFQQVLDRYFDGAADSATDRLL